MVSSTTPRFGPRCPPVCERTLINSSRTSSASCGNSDSFSALTSAGERIPCRSALLARTGLEEADVVICRFSLGWRGGRGGRVRFWLKFLHDWLPGMVAGDNLDSLLRAGQTLLASFYQLHSLLVAHDEVFQHHLPALHLIDNSFQPIHRCFEIQLRPGFFRGS